MKKATPIPEKMQYFMSVCSIYILSLVSFESNLLSIINCYQHNATWHILISTKCTHQPNVVGSKLTLIRGVSGSYFPYKKDDIGIFDFGLRVKEHYRH